MCLIKLIHVQYMRETGSRIIQMMDVFKVFLVPNFQVDFQSHVPSTHQIRSSSTNQVTPSSPPSIVDRVFQLFRNRQFTRRNTMITHGAVGLPSSLTVFYVFLQVAYPSLARAFIQSSRTLTRLSLKLLA